jgi:hypothetical protein
MHFCQCRVGVPSPGLRGCLIFRQLLLFSDKNTVVAGLAKAKSWHDICKEIGNVFACRKSVKNLYMKKLVVLACGWMLTLNLLSADQPVVSDADQKWLAAVEKMVASGSTQVSTPVEARTQLVQDWAKKNGYSVKITKAESTYQVEFSKVLAKN